MSKLLSAHWGREATLVLQIKNIILEEDSFYQARVWLGWQAITEYQEEVGCL